MHIIVTVSNDLVTDQRVKKMCQTLVSWGHSVHCVGVMRRKSWEVDQNMYKITRLSLLFQTGPLFYASLNVRMFLFLLFQKTNMIYANDLDTLPAARMVSLIRRKPIVYDTHEYFTEVPELVRRPFVQFIWKKIEQLFFKGLKHIITVNQSIADLYEQEYGKKLKVIRNIPMKPEQIVPASREGYGISKDTFILILQGNGINIDRGAEEALLMMPHLDNCLLIIAGSGDVIPQLKKQTFELNLTSKVRFIDRLPWNELMKITAMCDLGLTLDKGNNINYLYSLPNKIFDYIHAGIPVFASDLPEIARIIRMYNVGYIHHNHNPLDMANAVKDLIQNKNQLSAYRDACKMASNQLIWENEVEQVKEWFE